MENKPNLSSELIGSLDPTKGDGKRVQMLMLLAFDRRISFMIKLLLIGAVLYVFLPDLIIGPWDDAVVVYALSNFFIVLCKYRHPEVYKEHYDKLVLNRVSWRDRTSGWEQDNTAWL